MEANLDLFDKYSYAYWYYAFSGFSYLNLPIQVVSLKQGKCFLLFLEDSISDFIISNPILEFSIRTKNKPRLKCLNELKFYAFDTIFLKKG